MRSFETEDRHASSDHRPVRVPKRKDEAFAAARELCEDIGWSIVEADEGRHVLRCRRKGGWLGGDSTIEVWIEGPDGLPSSTTYARSRSSGGIFARDRANVAEFVRKLTMRTM